MKSLDKNQDKQETVALHAAVISMQTHLTAACLKQGLKISTTISQNDGDVPVLSYAISFNTDEPVVFTGQARSAQEPHYQTMFELIHGRMVSEIFPPTIRTVKQDTDEGSNDPVEVPISYWKRRLVIEHDITVRDPDPKASQSDGLHMLARKSVWVGYNTKSEEIIRVDEGSANFAPETVERVQYMELGPRGMVVIVIYKDTVRLVQGQQGTFAEALKTAQAGFEPAGATSAGASLSSAPTVSLSSLGTAGSSAASSGAVAAISNIDISAMSLAKKADIKPDSELGKAIARLSDRTASGSIRPAHLSIAMTDKIVSIYDLSNSLWDDARSYEGFKAYLPERGRVAKPNAAVLVVGKSENPRLILETADLLRSKKIYVVFAVEVSNAEDYVLDAPQVRELIATGFHPLEFGGDFSYLPYIRGNAKMTKNILDDVLTVLKAKILASTPEFKKSPVKKSAATAKRPVVKEKPVAVKKTAKVTPATKRVSRAKKPQSND